MHSANVRNPTLLFNDWKRRKDRIAGQQLAQSVADWYYAIATCFAGEELGAEIAESACIIFGEQVVRLSADEDLIVWAHGLLEAEIRKGGKQARGLNMPSVYSNARPPVDVLLYAKRELAEEVGLLEAAYRGDISEHKLAARAKSLGGYPFGILLARYAVKRLLRDDLKAPLAIVHDDPPRDLSPLPLYECDRLHSKVERARFEQWVIHSPELCQDIAEFAPFAIELRQGLPDRPPPFSLKPVRSRVPNMLLDPQSDPLPERPAHSTSQPPFMFERPTGRPAPQRMGQHSIFAGQQTGLSLRMRMSIGAIIFMLALALGLTLIN
jgi:hypothetical protein